MKKICIFFTSLFIAFIVNAQEKKSSGDKAEENCVDVKMDERSVPEKVIDKVVPVSEKVRENAAKEECKDERTIKAINNNEKKFIETYKKEPERNPSSTSNNKKETVSEPKDRVEHEPKERVEHEPKERVEHESREPREIHGRADR